MTAIATLMHRLAAPKHVEVAQAIVTDLKAVIAEYAKPSEGLTVDTGYFVQKILLTALAEQMTGPQKAVAAQMLALLVAEENAVWGRSGWADAMWDAADELRSAADTLCDGAQADALGYGADREAA